MSSEKIIQKIQCTMRRLSVGINIWAAVAGASIAILVALSAIMRYTIHSPFLWSDEVAGFLYFMFSFAALPLAFVEKKHIAIQLLFERIPKPARNYVNLCNYLFALVYLSVFTKVAWEHCLVTYKLHSISINAHLLIFPWQVVMPIFLGFFVLLVFIELIQVVQTVSKKGKEEVHK